MRVWDVGTGKYINSLTGHSGAVNAVAFSPDGKIIAGRDVLSRNKIKFWQTDPGAHLFTLEGHTTPVTEYVFSADSKTLASGSGNEIRLWKVNTGNPISSLDAVKNVAALALSPDGKTLASGTMDGQVQVWNLAPTPQIQSTFTGHRGSVYVLMFSPDGKTLASGSSDGTILLWNIEQ